MKKCKSANLLVLFLVFVMSIVAINVLFIVPNASGQGTIEGGGGGTETEPPGVLPPDGGDEDLPGGNVNYGKGDGLLAWNTAYDMYLKCSGMTSKSVGQLSYSMGINQQLNSSRAIYSNGNSLTTAYSEGAQSHYQETFYMPKKQKVYTYAGKTSSSSKEFNEYEEEFYSNQFGRPIGFYYDISAESVSEVSVEKDKSTPTNTVITLKIDNVLGTKAYSKTIHYVAKQILSSAPPPIFDSAMMTFVVNKAGQLVSVRCVDAYHFEMAGLRINGTSDVTEKLTFKYMSPKTPSWVDNH